MLLNVFPHLYGGKYMKQNLEKPSSYNIFAFKFSFSWLVMLKQRKACVIKEHYLLLS